jgi:aryl-alcohol dehydrogenase-like predicted oxidoreductase
MEFRNLGNSGLQVSTVGLGCMNFGMANDEAESAAVVHKALDLGVNLFDTADVYGERGKSEKWLGRALGKHRPEIIIATKFAGPMSADRNEMQGGSRRYIMQAVEASLHRLGTDYIDLYQMHLTDPKTPVEETIRALDDLVSQGKVRYVGCSNYAAWQVADAQWTAREHHLTAFISAQNRYSLLTREIEKELVPACDKHGLGILPYFPLESGLLTGKYKRNEDPPEGSRLARWSHFSSAFASEDKHDQVDQLTALCERYGHSLLELAMSWLVAQPFVSSVIAGVTTPEQLEQNVAAGACVLSSEELAEVDEISPPPQAPSFGPRR